jgi:PAS domain S-box-containing protein
VARFRLTFDQSPLGSVMISPDFRFLRVNEMFCRITGYSSGELLQKGFPDITHPDDLARDVASVKQLVAGQIDRYETNKRYIRKDGKVVWAHLVARMMNDASGRSLYSLATVEDIGERKRAEAALLESQTELQAIYDHAPVMMCVLNADRQVQYVNRALAAFVGKPQTELVRDRACGIFGCANALDDPRGCGFGPNCEQCALRLAMLDTLRTGESHAGIEYRATLLLNRTPQEVILMGSTARIRSAGQDMLLLCLSDITAFTRAEQSRRRLEAQVLHAQKLESLGVLAGGIAHDFNNLLGAIVSNVDLAKQQLPPGSSALPHVER